MIAKLDSLFLIFVVIAIFIPSCTTRIVMAVHDTRETKIASNAININTASSEELERIPHIGPKLAGEIVRFRERHGRFRRPEYLMLIRGFSDTRYREMKDFIRIE